MELKFKKCRVCGEDRSEDDFYRRANGRSFTQCKSCHIAYSVKRRRERAARGEQTYNRDLAAARAMAWASANRERRREIARAYDARHKEEKAARAVRLRARLKATDIERYRRNNRAGAHNRRVRRTGAGHIPARWVRALFELFERPVCVVCGDTNAKLVLDHYVPLSRGGRHEVGNVIPICAACNSSKASKLPAEVFSPADRAGIESFLAASRLAYLDSIEIEEV